MSRAETINARKRPSWPAVDRLGILIALIAIIGAVLPFALFRANRIVSGEGRSLAESLPAPQAGLLAALLATSLLAALLRIRPVIKLGSGAVALAGLFLLVGVAASTLTPPENNFARVSPASGFWLLVCANALLVADALTRLQLGPWPRIAILISTCAGFAALLASGAWNDLSILKEYAVRAPAFWQEARIHLLLTFGSVAAAISLGIPLHLLL